MLKGLISATPKELGALHKLRHPFLDHFRHPLPPVIMSSFDIPPTPPDYVIYVQDNQENV